MLVKFMLSPFGLKLDRFLVKWTGASLLNRIFARNSGFEPQPALLLATRGRKSGKKREVALPYFRIDNRVVLVGSKGGAPTDPFWVQNLREDPQVTVYLQRKPYRVRAYVASGEERAGFWGYLTDTVPSYRDYEKMTAREIPVVVLEGL